MGAAIQIFTIQMVEGLMLNKISNIEIDPTIVRAGLGRQRWLFNHLSCFSLFAKTNTLSLSLYYYQSRQQVIRITNILKGKGGFKQ
jgi:hypothetical protein